MKQAIVIIVAVVSFSWLCSLSVCALQDEVFAGLLLPTDGVGAYEPLVTIGKPELRDILYSPDGRFLATLTSSYVELLDAEDYAPVTRIPAGGVDRRLAFSPDGSLLAISGSREGIQVWHVDSETFLANIPTEEDIAAFSPDGKYLAYAGEDSASLWDVERQETVLELTDDTRPFSSRIETIAFHPNGRILAVGAHNQAIALWDIETGEILSYLELEFEDYPDDMIFSHDGTFLAAVARYGMAGDYTMRLWDVDTGDSRYRTGEFHGLAFTPDDQHLLVGGGNGNLYVMETGTFRMERIPAVDHLPPPNVHNFSRLERLTFHPDG